MYEYLYLQNVQSAMDEAIEIVQNKLNLQARIRSKKVPSQNMKKIKTKTAILCCFEKHYVEFSFQQR